MDGQDIMLPLLQGKYTHTILSVVWNIYLTFVVQEKYFLYDNDKAQLYF